MNGLDLNDTEKREWTSSQESYLLGLCGVYCCCLNVSAIQDIPGVSETSTRRYYTGARKYLKRQFTARYLSEMFTFHYKTATRKQWAIVELTSAKSTSFGIKKWHRYAATVNSWTSPFLPEFILKCYFYCPKKFKYVCERRYNHGKGRFLLLYFDFPCARRFDVPQFQLWWVESDWLPDHLTATISLFLLSRTKGKSVMKKLVR